VIQETLKSLPPHFYIDSLKAFVPSTIIIAFEEDFEGSKKIDFPFIKEEPSQKTVKGVSIASDVNIDDVDY
jgi:hypothetical protein